MRGAECRHGARDLALRKLRRAQAVDEQALQQGVQLLWASMSSTHDRYTFPAQLSPAIAGAVDWQFFSLTRWIWVVSIPSRSSQVQQSDGPRYLAACRL